MENDLEAAFFQSLTNHVGNYTIAELTDKKIKQKDGKYYLYSNTYHINIEIEDDDVLTALINGLYVSAFLSRQDDSYQVHFLCHKYPESMKARFDEAILAEVMQYMMLKTVIALRLDTEKKIKEYCGIAGA